MKLEDKNPHEKDKLIKQDDDFENNHIYIIEGQKEHNKISVTTFIHQFFPKFEEDDIIQRNYYRWQRDIHPIYYAKTQEEIKQLWKENKIESSRRGNYIHKLCEDYLNNQIQDSCEPEFKHFLDFVKDYPNFEPYRTEFMCFNDKVVGTCDLIVKDQDGKYIIIDFKTSKEIKMNNIYQNGLYPIQHIQDCNYYHYCLQLSTYKLILEEFYNLDIKDMYVMQLRAENSSYKLYQCQDLTKEVKDMLKEL